MNKSLIILYLLIFVTYIVWTRQPDYFDGEIYPGMIRLDKNSSGQIIPKADYSVGLNKYTINAGYPLSHYTDGEQINIILEHEHPDKGVVYRFWGYWITWEELLASIIIAILLFQIAVSITNNPSDESLQEQLTFKVEIKTKYD